MQLTIENPSVAAAVNQEELCNSIIANLNSPELSPLEQYAIAVMLKKSAEAAAKILSNNALIHALRVPKKDDPNECYEKASAGKQFTHRGFVYAVTFKPEYNYAQPDEHGREWVKTVKEIEELSKTSTAKNKYKDGLQAIILQEHPQLKPFDPVPTELAFKPKAKGDETA